MMNQIRCGENRGREKVGCRGRSPESENAAPFSGGNYARGHAKVIYAHGALQCWRPEVTHCMRGYVSVGPHLGRVKWLLGFGPGNGGTLAR